MSSSSTLPGYRGARVTVMGVPAARVIAVTDYNTQRQSTLGPITAHQHGARTVYRVVWNPDELPDRDGRGSGRCPAV